MTPIHHAVAFLRNITSFHVASLQPIMHVFHPYSSDDRIPLSCTIVACPFSFIRPSGHYLNIFTLFTASLCSHLVEDFTIRTYSGTPYRLQTAYNQTADLDFRLCVFDVCFTIQTYFSGAHPFMDTPPTLIPCLYSESIIKQLMCSSFYYLPVFLHQLPCSKYEHCSSAAYRQRRKKVHSYLPP